MVLLQTYFENNFDDKQISDDELKQFSEAFIADIVDYTKAKAADPD